MATPRIAPVPQNGQAAQAQPTPHPAAPAAAPNRRPPAEINVRPEVVAQMIGGEGGWVAVPYNDQAGNCTSGAGHLRHNGPCSPDERRMHLSADEMHRDLRADLRDAEDGVRRNVRRPLTQGEYDALVSLTFNAGAGGARPVFHEINRNGPDAAAQVILTTAIHVAVRDPHNPHRVIGHTISHGLQNRRHRELAVYQGREPGQ